MPSYAFILRACPEAARPVVAQFLGKAFSLKDSTCSSIAESAPIIVLADLSEPEAAVINVVLSGMGRAGAQVELSTSAPDELPKIDWPRKPQVFKRDLADHVADYQAAVTVAGGGKIPLIDLLISMINGQPLAMTPSVTPASGAAPRSEFKGTALPEITPFGGIPTLAGSTGTPSNTPVRGSPINIRPMPGNASSPARAAISNLPPPPGPTTSAPSGSHSAVSADAAHNRLNELFPEDESAGFMPNNSDISSILDKLLPDETGSGLSNAVGGVSSARAAIGGGSGFSVFLAKISDEARRQKAVPLIAELSKISNDEAETLSRKVIIPVLKGASKADAEAAKQKFAKIGILARVKGPE